MVLAEAGVGIADGADQPGVEIGTAPDVIQRLPGFGIHHEAVDGEVAAQHVGLRVGFKVHGVGPAAVFIFVVAAEGGHFHLREGVAHQNHAEVRADQTGIGKQVHDAVRPRVGGKVEILGSGPAQQIAHATADEPGLVPGAAQPAITWRASDSA